MEGLNYSPATLKDRSLGVYRVDLKKEEIGSLVQRSLSGRIDMVKLAFKQE